MPQIEMISTCSFALELCRSDKSPVPGYVCERPFKVLKLDHR